VTDLEHFSPDQFENIILGRLTNGGNGHAVSEGQLLDADILLNEIESVEEVVNVDKFVKVNRAIVVRVNAVPKLTSKEDGVLQEVGVDENFLSLVLLNDAVVVQVVSREVQKDLGLTCIWPDHVGNLLVVLNRDLAI